MKAQYNAVTNKAYEGGNQDELIAQKVRMGFTSDAWATFLQIKSLGRFVKKGSKSVHIFRGFEETEVRKNGKLVTESRPLGWASVFNLDQTETK